MAEGWKLEAINQQFDVFQSLSESHQKISLNDFTSLSNAVSTIIQQHKNMLKEESSVRHIAAEIIKNSGNENIIKLSFSVIIINQYVKNRLCKMPVFIVKSGNQTIFIDVASSVYNSWAAFMEQNDLPKCEFCFPFNGQYNVGGNLKIQIAKSPKALCSSSINQTQLLTVCGIAVAAVVIVACFFYKCTPTMFTWAECLLPIAEAFKPNISRFIRPVLELIKQFVKYKAGSIGMIKLMSEMFRILKPLHNQFGKEVSEILKEVKETLKQCYDYIYRMFSKFFSSSSASDEHEVATLALKFDNDIRKVQDEECQFDNRHIFENCTDEYAFHTEVKDKDNKELSLPVKNLLDISRNIANNLQTENLNDAKCIFEAISSIVTDEYRNQLKTYNKAVSAAKAATGHDINIEAFNKSFGVVGQPKDHFWNEALQSTKRSRLTILLKEKMEMLKKQKKPYMVKVWNDEQTVTGLYRINGVQGEGRVSSCMIINMLRESSCSIDLDKENIKITEDNDNSGIIILSKHYTIMVYQEIAEKN